MLVDLTLDEIRARSMARTSLALMVLSVAAGVALVAVLLSCIGLYGVMAYHVARRSGEIGIRMALGSTAWRIVGPILKGALLMVASGVALGLPAVIAAGRMLREHLFEIEPTDPLTVVAAILLLVVAAVAGALVPARRTCRSGDCLAM